MGKLVEILKSKVSLVIRVINPLSDAEFLLKINESAILLNLNSQNDTNY